MSMTWTALEVTDHWRVVDKWWTDKPTERLFMSVRAPDGSSVAIGYDMETKRWSVHEDPRTEIKVDAS